MKKTLVYLFCVCFPLLATNNTKQPLFIGHETCNINIYAGLSALADSLNNHVDYNIKKSLIIARERAPNCEVPSPGHPMYLYCSVYFGRLIPLILTGSSPRVTNRRYDSWKP